MASIKVLPPPASSSFLLARINPEHVAMFRFLLEAYDNMALFSVLEKNPCLLKIVFSPHCLAHARQILAEMRQSLPFEIEDWPL